jgi:hypothetical protein
MGQASSRTSSSRAKRWTASEIVVSNIPSMLTYFLGTLIMFHLGMLIGILYIVFVVVELVLFMRFVCIYCPTYDSVHCPSGYGRVAAKLFKRGHVSEFKSMFNKYIPILSLVWVVPVIGAVLLLLGDFSFYYIGLLISFVIVGYVILPFFHRRFECRDCPNKENCPWGK